MATSKRILIAGAGLAGPALALMLSRAGHKCTIVEKAENIRSEGQQVDVAGDGLEVVDFMGIREDIVAERVFDEGGKAVDSNDNVIARFPASESSSIVREIEILRPDLAAILYNKTKDSVSYRFGDYITELKTHEHGVTVTFANASERTEFDVVVAADGLGSSTRKLAFPSNNSEIVSLNQYALYFFIPWTEADGNWTRWYNATKGRTIVLRPHTRAKLTGAYLCQISPDSSRLARLSPQEQRKEIASLFADAGWESKRILAALEDVPANGIYLQAIAQCKSARLVNGRVALLGDSGYCPSPVSGQGTTLALVGSYILAGCIATHDDIHEALNQYESQMRPFVEKAQKLMYGIPWIVNPQTKTGIAILHFVFRVVSLLINSGIPNVVKAVAGRLPPLKKSGPQLPDFPLLPSAEMVQKAKNVTKS